MGKLLALALLLTGCSYQLVTGDHNVVKETRAPVVSAEVDEDDE